MVIWQLFNEFILAESFCDMIDLVIETQVKAIETSSA